MSNFTLIRSRFHRNLSCSALVYCIVSSLISSYLAFSFDVFRRNDIRERRSCLVDVENCNRIREQSEVLCAVEVGDRDASPTCVFDGRGKICTAWV